MVQKEKSPREPSEWLRKKREQVNRLKGDVEEFEEELKLKKEQRRIKKATRDIHLWMDNFIFPYLEGISGSFNEPLLAGIKRLIRENKNPFRPKNDWNRTREAKVALAGFFENPQAKVLYFMAKPYIQRKIEWIHEQAEWIRDTILKTEYPEFYDVIMQTEGGKEWLDQLITDLASTIKRGRG